MKTAELTGVALDWAVAICSGMLVSVDLKAKPPALHLRGVKQNAYSRWRPSIKWVQAGPIIERERISLGDASWDDTVNWAATIYEGFDELTVEGPTPLIAAMRCYVASRLGDEVEIPKELL